MHPLAFSNAYFRHPGCIYHCYTVHSRTILRRYRDRYDEATSLYPSVFSCEGTDTITSTHGGVERKRRKRMAASEHTRDVGVTAFAIQAFCANSCLH